MRTAHAGKAAVAFGTRAHLALLALLPLLVLAPVTTASDRLLDDFSRADGRAQSGAAWQGFSDRVMGGVSDLRAGYRTGPDGSPLLAMSGTVRTENNGGFIQLRLPLSERGQALDARGFDGVVLRARGQPGPYFVHLRTRDSVRPWEYYAAPLMVSDEWHDIVVPFTAFAPRSTRRPLDLASLVSVAIVAYGEPFEADIELQRIALRAARPR
jgi:hypothetical protein